MINIRKSEDRAAFDHGWLKTRHTFSFASYYDEAFVGFRNLRVINEDQVVPNAGFGMHGHRDMEILTYVLDGQLSHKDSLGNGSTIQPGEIQRMSAGTGIRHSEFNPSASQPVHFYQIWIEPKRLGQPASYEEKAIGEGRRHGALKVIATHDGADGSAVIHADAGVYAGKLDAGETVRHALAPGRHAWLQVARGEVTLNGSPLRAGDGAAVSNEQALEIVSTTSSEVLLFDLA